MLMQSKELELAAFTEHMTGAMKVGLGRMMEALFDTSAGLSQSRCAGLAAYPSNTANTLSHETTMPLVT